MTMIIMTNVMSLIVRSLDSMINNLEKVLRPNVGDGNKKQTNKQTNKRHFPGQPQCECSFEFSEWRVTYTSFRAKLIIIYRPPHSQVRNIQSPLVYSSRNSVPILSQSFCLQSRFYYLVTLIFI